MARRDLTKPPVGEKFGALTVLGYHAHAARSRALWRFRCDCGMETLISASAVLCGQQSNCSHCARNRNAHRDAVFVAGFASGKTFLAIAAEHGVGIGVVSGAIFRAQKRGELQGRTIVARSST